MKMKNRQYRLSRQEMEDQRYQYIANQIIPEIKQTFRVIALTSSSSVIGRNDMIGKQLAEYISLQNIKCVLICENEKNVKSKLNSLSDKCDAVILSLPPVRLFADSLQNIKLSDQIFLVEQYGQTHYVEFEETLQLLKMNALEVSGIIVGN